MDNKLDCSNNINKDVFILKDTGNFSLKKNIQDVVLIKHKIVRDIFKKLYYIDNPINTDVLEKKSQIDYQIKKNFLDFLSNNENIKTIILNVNEILRNSTSIIDFLILDDCNELLKKQTDNKNYIFKFGYFHKVFNIDSPCDLYHYHNCMIIFFYVCHIIKKNSKSSTYDLNIANLALCSLHISNIFNK